MDGVSKPVKWKSCSEGHLYLGEKCPCEEAGRRYRSESRRPQGERSSSPAPDARDQLLPE